MKRSPKALSLLLAMMMSLALIGCGKSSDSSSQAQDTAASANPSDGSQTAEAETAQEEIVELTMAYLVISTSASDMQLVEDEINKISEPEIGVRINIEAINIGDYTTQVNLMLNSGESLDIIQALNTNFSSWYSNGSIVPITAELEQYGQGIVDAVGEEYLEAGRINGEQYGITTNRDLATGYGFNLRTDLLEKYQIDPSQIQTLDDMEEVLAIIHENEPSLVPLTINTEGAKLFNNMRAGVDPLGDYLGVLLDMESDTLTVENLFESERYREFVEKMYDWNQKGYIQSDAATSSEVGPTLMRSGGTFAISVTTKPGLATQVSTETGQPITMVEIYPADTCTTTVQLLQYAVAHNCEHVDKAVQFLNLLYTNPDVANLLAWGIEGKHYEIQEDGHIDFPEGVDASNSGYNLNQGWLVGNQFITYVWVGDDLDIWEQLDHFNKTAIVSKAMGFTFNAEPVKTEYAACSAVLEQYRCALESGAMEPESTLEQFNDALYNAGLQTIIDEKQNQLNEWAANN